MRDPRVMIAEKFMISKLKIKCGTAIHFKDGRYACSMIWQLVLTPGKSLSNR